MSYSYLIDLYHVLDERINQLDNENSPDHTRADESEYQQGRRDCLVDFKKYLEKNYHHKLPRRIQRAHKP
jgi:hypothetical protein